MNLKKSLTICGVIIITVAVGIFAADHIDAPAVEGTSSDITDFYAFQSPSDNSNMVFNVNTQALLSPSDTENATFNPNTMIEINIDNTGDLVEDLVIQCVFTEDEVFAYGPAAPQSTGLDSQVNLNAQQVSAKITEFGENPRVGTNNGISLFAGPRDDPFFFDFERYTAIINGNESSFRDPGVDTFAGTNVMALVVEVPKNMLGDAETLNVWATSNQRSN